MSSLWEDPGFVLIEAAVNNCFIISSDCKSGPNEILEDGKGGLLFRNDDIESLKKKIREYLILKNEDMKKMKINVKKNIKKYSLIQHYKLLTKLIYDQEKLI